MKHHSSDFLILSAFCSFCGEDFQDGAARFIVGDFPLEQFCSRECTGNFLKLDLREELPVQPGLEVFGANSPFSQEQGEKS